MRSEPLTSHLPSGMHLLLLCPAPHPQPLCQAASRMQLKHGHYSTSASTNGDCWETLDHSVAFPPTVAGIRQRFVRDTPLGSPTARRCFPGPPSSLGSGLVVEEGKRAA